MSAVERGFLASFYEAFSRRDLERLLDSIPKDFEWRLSAADPEARAIVGKGAIAREMGGLFDAFDELHTEIEDIVELDDRYVVPVHHRARGRDSQAVTQRREVHLWTFQSGQPLRMWEFATKEDALRAQPS